MTTQILWPSNFYDSPIIMIPPLLWLPNYYASLIIMTPQILWLSNYSNYQIIMTPQFLCLPDYYDPNYCDFRFIMTSEVWSRLNVDITMVRSYILFTILIVNTELEHNRIIISVRFLYWSYLVLNMNKKYMLITKLYNKDIVT